MTRPPGRENPVIGPPAVGPTERIAHAALPLREFGRDVQPDPTGAAFTWPVTASAPASAVQRFNADLFQ
jgi:hypothetical protein